MNEIVLGKAKKYCGYQERCQQEVRDRLYELGLHKNEVEEMIAQLISEGFLNEQRFAIAYAGGKFRMKEWGRVKIKQALINKRVSKECIAKALNEISDDDYQKTLMKVISKKINSVKETDSYKRNYKVAQFTISRGFEPELVWQALKLET